MASKKKSKPTKALQKAEHISPIEIVSSLDDQIAKLEIAKGLTLEKAMKSRDLGEIMKTQSYLKTIEKRDDSLNAKSVLIDPQQYWGAQGYKQKNYNLSYDMLRAMSRTDIVKPVIQTRIEEVIRFCSPQKDKYATGFRIRPKKILVKDGKEELTKAQEKRIEELTEFVLNCGNGSNEWHGDNFHTFTRKFIQDSLALDQGCAEVIADKRGLPAEFIAIDGATARLAATFNDDETEAQGKEKVQGYLPYYVQIYQARIVAEFYPWELMFGIRNPQTSIYSNGYGRSELEDLIETVTAMLNSSQYNANYFKIGSNPKGILRVSGNVNPGRMEEFETTWFAKMTGVKNAHRMPIIESDKMDFISTQSSNKDMEYSKYYEFLIKIVCAHYKMDPAQINFSMVGESGGGGAFRGGDTEDKLEESKQRGLHPLLDSYANWLNKWIINRLDSEYEFVFEGLNTKSPEEELDSDIKAVQYLETLNEVRRRRGLKDIDGGDQVLNPILAQQKMMDQQMKMGMGQSQPQDYTQEEDNEEQQEKSEKISPLVKELQEDFNKLFVE